MTVPQTTAENWFETILESGMSGSRRHQAVVQRSLSNNDDFLCEAAQSD